MGATTHFASAVRSLPEELEKDIKLAVNNPITTEIMRLAGGMVAVVNENRQIIATNEGFQDFLGVDNAETLLGMRPGEALQCVYADQMDAGCGTSLQCASCGAIGAMLDAQEQSEITERRSAVQIRSGEGTTDLCVWIRACPVTHEGRRFVVLFITDITEEERQFELERIFHHDVLNTALGISSACRLLERRYEHEDEARQYAKVARSLSSRLMKDIRVHKLLSELHHEEFRPDRERIDLVEFMRELKEIADTWPAAQGINVELAGMPDGLTIHSDPHLLYRVMTNMLLNACEASDEDGTVRFWTEKFGERAVLKVWNDAHIPEHIAPRIFQRHFSTKHGRGRGIGTYSMKFIGEQLLGGQVSFESSEEHGTVFSLSLG